ncbi:putative MFS multidrug transporter [Rhizodiscina lignyota]|uniref:MFS multidrug transporter n=1 Tax=Rhizodiscina lignyota TaxID=1504668 RepID=A0A9P4I5B7_9PEZI|nr:putative MFS multidrug transporter [Rhizodiscina lignyota]
MATPGVFLDPAINDLSDSQSQAYEEGHDADADKEQSNGSPQDKHEQEQKHQHASAKALEVDFDKDVEKGTPSRDSSDEETVPVDAQKQEAPKPVDPNIVDWEQPADQDPMNPMNWSSKKKWGNIAILSLLSFTTPLASSMFAPGVPQVMQKFHETSDLLAAFVVSIYILGFTIGPLIVAPLSEMYGRLPLYLISNIVFVIFTVACAVSTNMSMLIVFRLFEGCFGATPITLGGGTIADLMPVEKRGGAMAIWAMGPLIGPVAGPVAGGFLVQAVGWRWVFWVIAIAAGTFCIVAFFLMRETYGPVILARKAAKLRKETGNPNLRSKFDTGETTMNRFKRSIVRPSKLLLLSPIVLSLSTYTALVYGILYLLFTTFTFVFQGQYGFSEGVTGLVYIALGIGMLLGLAIMGPVSDGVIKSKQRRGIPLRPEDRLPLFLTLPGALCIPSGLFIYGWTTQYHIHWIVPLIGTCFVGIGLLTVFMTIQTYLVDAFTIHAASAVAANAVARSLFGALLPLGGLKMYNALGLGWGNSLLGFLALAMVPLPILFNRYGEFIRTYPKFQVKL